MRQMPHSVLSRHESCSVLHPVTFKQVLSSWAMVCLMCLRHSQSAVRTAMQSQISWRWQRSILIWRPTSAAVSMAEG